MKDKSHQYFYLAISSRFLCYAEPDILEPILSYTLEVPKASVSRAISDLIKMKASFNVEKDDGI